MVDITPVDVSIVKFGSPDHEFEKYYNLKEGDVYLEAGAFYGRQAMIASQKGCSKIILIEPSPINIATIENLIKLGEIKNVVLVKKAVSNEKKVVRFNVSGPSCGHSLQYVDNNPNVVDVNMDTIDNILTELGIEYVDLFACDVEGAEVDMVIGTDKYFTEKRIRNIALGAYHHPSLHPKILEILENKGYKDLTYDNYGGVIYGHV